MLLSLDIWNDENLVKVLKGNGVAVMPTDTLYGLVGKAKNKETVNRIYKLRKRNPKKPCIILIGDMKELQKFGLILTVEQKNEIKKYQEPTSFILDCPDEKFSYLHRGTHTLAFRLPQNKDLQNLLKKTGPLIAPSANLEAMPSAQNITDAKKYFGAVVDPVRGREGSQRASTSNGVDLYVDGGIIKGKASKVIELRKDGSISILRE